MRETKILIILTDIAVAVKKGIMNATTTNLLSNYMSTLQKKVHYTIR